MMAEPPTPDGSPILLGHGRIFLSPSRSHPLRPPYLTVQFDSGEWACACPAARECHHIREAKAQGDVEPSPALLRLIAERSTKLKVVR